MAFASADGLEYRGGAGGQALECKTPALKRAVGPESTGVGVARCHRREHAPGRIGLADSILAPAPDRAVHAGSSRPRAASRSCRASGLPRPWGERSARAASPAHSMTRRPAVAAARTRCDRPRAGGRRRAPQPRTPAPTRRRGWRTASGRGRAPLGRSASVVARGRPTSRRPGAPARQTRSGHPRRDVRRRARRRTRWRCAP